MTTQLQDIARQQTEVRGQLADAAYATSMAWRALGDRFRDGVAVTPETVRKVEGEAHKHRTRMIALFLRLAELDQAQRTTRAREHLVDPA